MKNSNNILERTRAGLIITDLKGKIISLGGNVEDIVGKSYYKKFIESKNKFNFGLQTSGLLNSGKHSINWKYNLTFDDHSILLNINSYPVYNDKGVVCEILNIFNGIPENKNIEDTLKSSSKNIESVLYSISPDGKYFYYITEAVIKLFGYTPSEIMKSSKLILKQVVSRDFSIYKKFIRNLINGKPSIAEYEVIDKWGKSHFLRNSGFPVIENEQVIRVDGIVNDITKEKKIQADLEKSEEKFRILIETANDLIFTLDSHGYFLDVNSYGALSLGYKPEEMKNKHFLEFIQEDNKAEIAIAFQKILKTEKINSFESTFIDKFGNSVVFEIQGRPTKLNSVITGMLGIGRDITQRLKDEKKLKELNTKLIEANRIISIERDRAKQQVSVLEEVNKLKSEFISNISHELRTPLASIVGFSETISLDPDMTKEMITEFNNIILSEGKRLAKLINDLLDFAKMEGRKIELYKTEFDVVDLIQTIVKSYSKATFEKGLTIDTEIPEYEIMIYADKERINQVYNHIVGNSIKFTNPGGRIKIIAQDFQNEFEVIISDTGIGIPEQDITNIFNKFFKTDIHAFQSGSGIGIGLGLVKQIVDLHKGMITVQSEVKKGTTFVIKFPKNKNNRVR
jgi:PAS domain S-box-containing protein